MANQNGIKRTFDPNKSSKAIAMLNMSYEEVFERYFIDDNGVEWLADFNRIKVTTDRYGKDIYKQILAVDLSGLPMRLIVSIIQKRLLEAQKPDGYKFNAKNFMDDLEVILQENPTLTLEAIGNTEEGKKFAVQLSNFFVDVLRNGLVYYHTDLNV